MSIHSLPLGRFHRAPYAASIGLLTIASAFATEQRASDLSFPSRQAAEDFLTEALPRATAANPRYITKGEGAETRWLTKSVRFEEAPSGIRVSMDEEFTQTKSGAVTLGSHEAVFSLADVDISTTTLPSDVTPSNEPSRAVMFTCATPKCVDGTWNGRTSSADHADVSIQDEALLARIVEAFRLLKGLGKFPG